LPAEGKGGMFP